jgi:RNA polymerase sigma-70 factor (ECF subfamily)
MTVELDVDESTAETPIETSKGPLDLYVRKKERERVREAIQQLPAEFREIVILREFEELSYQEIASLLKCPEGTVMSRLARARSKLRTLLSAAGQSAAIPTAIPTAIKEKPKSTDPSTRRDAD